VQSQLIRRSTFKKNNNSSTKSEPCWKQPKSRVSVQRDSKEGMADLLGKLAEKLDPKAISATAGKEKQRDGLRPNLDRLTVGVDLGDQWSDYCILGLGGETLIEGQLPKTQEDVATFFQALPGTRVVIEVGTPFRLGAGTHRGVRTRGAGGQPAADGRIEASQAEE
jgi:hypothetical protein